MLLDGKVALITGAATGIGQTGAYTFAREGAKVVVADINDKDGEETVAEIKKQGGEALFVHVDVTSVAEIEQMFGPAIETYGRLDIFWHNAGGSMGGHIDLTTEELFDEQVATNLKAGVFGAKFAIPEIRKAGGGSILFTSSMVGLRPTPYSPGYSLTYGLVKAGLVMLTRCLVTPLARDHIRVNCLCPGPVATPRVAAARKKRAEIEGLSLEEFEKASAGRIPLGRDLTTQEVANTALFLVSDMGSGITGVALPVDGGFTAL